MEPEIFSTIAFVTIFFLLLISIIIIVALLYHSRKRTHKIEVSNFQNVLIQAQFEVQEQTMQTIATDLHDNIGQLLSLTSFTLKSIPAEDDLKSRKKIDSAIELTVRAIKEMRQLGKLLQADQLIAAGLAEAIRYEVEWLERSGRFEINYVYECDTPEGNREKDLIVFRILQEVINNILKHSAANRINIKMDFKNMQLHLFISDNGIGFDPETLEKPGMGLHNINKRAAVIGGETTIRSKPGEGTAITVIIPY